jgi:hypothetical protein
MMSVKAYKALMAKDAQAHKGMPAYGVEGSRGVVKSKKIKESLYIRILMKMQLYLSPKK